MDQINERIAIRAYQLFKDRFGGQAPLDDWLKAEWELKNNHVKETGDKMTLNPDQSSPDDI
jgi:hypothetical protein